MSDFVGVVEVSGVGGGSVGTLSGVVEVSGVERGSVGTLSGSRRGVGVGWR